MAQTLSNRCMGCAAPNLCGNIWRAWNRDWPALLCHMHPSSMPRILDLTRLLPIEPNLGSGPVAYGCQTCWRQKAALHFRQQPTPKLAFTCAGTPFLVLSRMGLIRCSMPNELAPSCTPFGCSRAPFVDHPVRDQHVGGNGPRS